MNDSVSRFPVSMWKRILNRRGAKAVNCVVSDRYLLFGEVGTPARGYYPDRERVGTPLVLDVMSDVDSDHPGRKLCRLVVTIEDLRLMIDKVEASEASK